MSVTYFLKSVMAQDMPKIACSWIQEMLETLFSGLYFWVKNCPLLIQTTPSALFLPVKNIPKDHPHETQFFLVHLPSYG